MHRYGTYVGKTLSSTSLYLTKKREKVVSILHILGRWRIVGKQRQQYELQRTSNNANNATKPSLISFDDDFASLTGRSAAEYVRMSSGIYGWEGWNVEIDFSFTSVAACATCDRSNKSSSTWLSPSYHCRHRSWNGDYSGSFKWVLCPFCHCLCRPSAQMKSVFEMRWSTSTMLHFHVMFETKPHSIANWSPDLMSIYLSYPDILRVLGCRSCEYPSYSGIIRVSVFRS